MQTFRLTVYIIVPPHPKLGSVSQTKRYDSSIMFSRLRMDVSVPAAHIFLPEWTPFKQPDARLSLLSSGRINLQTDSNLLKQNRYPL